MTKKAAKARRKSISGVTQAALAKHLDCSQPRISQLVDEGVFNRLPNGTLDIDVSRIAFIRWLRDETRKSSSSLEAKRVHSAKAAVLEMQLAKMQGELVAFDDVLLWQGEILSALCLEMSGLAAACTRDVALRAVIQQHLDGAINRTKGRFGRMAAAAAAGRPFGISDVE